MLQAAEVSNIKSKNLNILPSEC